jgi:uncharacterized protein YjbI with pentapeptide repeats
MDLVIRHLAFAPPTRPWRFAAPVLTESSHSACARAPRTANQGLYDARIKAIVDAIRNKWWDLTEVNLRGAILNGAQLYASYMYGAVLEDAELNFANLFEAKIDRARLARAHLRNASLKRASMKEADLRKADLTGADLGGAN